MLGRLRSLLRPRPGSRRAYRFHLRYWFHPDADIAAGVLATLRPSRALAPELSAGPEAERLTIIAPHPDDEVIGPGGTLIKALARGCRVTVIFLTDGDPNAGTAAHRRAEALTVADRLGFTPICLGLPAETLAPDPEAVTALSTALRAAAPQVLLVPFVLDDNNDHRAASAVLDRAAAAAGLAPDLEVWAYQVYSALPANVLVPLGDDARAKAEAIRLYASQSGVRDWANFALGLNAYNTRLAPRRCQDPHVEAFYVLPLAEYLDIARNYGYCSQP